MRHRLGSTSNPVLFFRPTGSRSMPQRRLDPGPFLPGRGQAASRDPVRLLAYVVVALAAERYSHAPHPVAHRATKLDLGRVRLHRGGLQVEQDQPCPAAVRHAVEALALRQASGLDHEGEPARGALPDLIIGQTTVRERGQAETGVGDADRLTFLGQHLAGDIQKTWVDVGAG